MYTRCWQIVKDDAKKTFEVCGQTGNTNSFTNSIYAMQKAGMNVSCITPPVTNTNSNKDVIKVTGYTREVGLHKRLMDQHMKITFGSIEESD